MQITQKLNVTLENVGDVMLILRLFVEFSVPSRLFSLNTIYFTLITQTVDRPYK